MGYGICYELWLIAIATSTFVKSYSPKSFPSFKASLEHFFQQDNECPHVAKTVLDSCLAQHMQCLPWPVYSRDMLPIEHVWDLVGWRVTRDPHLATSKDEFWLCIQAI